MENHSANPTASSGVKPPVTQTKPNDAPPTKRKQRTNNQGPKKFKPTDSEVSSYLRTQIPPSVSMQPLKSFYTVYTSNCGLPFIVHDVYNCLEARIRGFDKVISLPQFKYVVTIAWCARLCEVAVASGTSFPRESTKLIKIARAIQLPRVLCRYIETLGKVDASNGIAIVPYCDNYRDLMPIGTEYFYDPLEALQDGMRPDPRNEWSIDEDWIKEYIQATTRYFRTGVDIISVSKELVGSHELFVGYEPQDPDVVPIASERLTIAVAELGASYRFRDYTDPQGWPFGDNYVLPRVYTSTQVNPDMLISDLTARTFNPIRLV